MIRNRQAHGARRGFSLVEVLIAGAIAVVVGMIVASLYRTWRMARDAQQEVSRHQAALHHAALLLSRDLGSAFHFAEEPATWLKLEPDPDGATFSRLQFAAKRFLPGEIDPSWTQTQQVVWRVETTRSSGSRLLRETRALSGPDSLQAVTNVLVEAVTAFAVQALGGEDDWTDAFATSAQSGWPEAVRFQLDTRDEVKDDPEAWTEVFIPIAHTVKSRLERGGGGEASPAAPPPSVSE